MSCMLVVYFHSCAKIASGSSFVSKKLNAGCDDSLMCVARRHGYHVKSEEEIMNHCREV